MVTAIIRDTQGKAGTAEGCPEGWPLADVTLHEPKDVKIKRAKSGRMLSYDYKAEVNLFYNVFVVVKFKDDFPMKPGSGDIDS